MADTFESHKKEILDSLEPIEKQLEAINTGLVNLDERHAKIVEHRGEITTSIHSKFNKTRRDLDTREAKFDEISRALDTCEAKIMAELEGHIQQQLNTLSTQREEVEILQTQRSILRERIRTGSLGDVLVEQVRDLVDTFDHKTLKPRETPNTYFMYVFCFAT